MTPYAPPYTITDKAVHLIAEISEQIGNIHSISELHSNPRLRHDSRLKTIQASLAIENNSLSLEQVTDIVNGRRVLGSPAEIQEVKNAYEAYEHLLTFDPYSISHMLKAHNILMSDLVRESGMFRSGDVGIFAGKKLVHMAPPAAFVWEQIHSLLQWIQTSEAHPLIKSCVFHYEFEFIHPFADGNGRMGRMWQTLLLSKWKPLFAWLPVESLIRERQEMYYSALRAADSASDAAPFIEFMLEAILSALQELNSISAQDSDQVSIQVKMILDKLGKDTLSANVLMGRLGLRHKATFRKNYLQPALDLGLVEMTVPDKPNSRNQKYRRAPSMGR